MLRRLDRWLGSRSRGVLCGIGLALIAVVGVIDHLSGYELSLSLLYLPAIALGAWYVGATAGVCLSLLSAVVWVTVDLTSGHPYSQAWIPLWNGFIRLGFFLVTGGLLTILQRELEQVDRLARVDSLTGTLNGRAFWEESARVFALCSRQSLPLTVVFLDLDDFKQVNDRGGHVEGDRVLAMVGAALLGAVRGHDVVGRLGGDEFALVLPGADRGRALTVLHRLTETVAQVPSTAVQSVSCSIGAVTFVSPPETLEGALAEADALMYRSKGRGKGAFVHEARG